MHMLKLLAAIAAIAVSLTVVARAAGPGNCGEYMYWKDGKCADARNSSAERGPLMSPAAPPTPIAVAGLVTDAGGRQQPRRGSVVILPGLARRPKNGG